MITRTSIIIRLCLLLAAFPAALRAALEWDAHERVLPATLEQAVLETSFTFTNNGPDPVVILDVRHSCGCTAAKLAKDLYEAGESGSIGITINLKGMTGAQSKSVSVYTSEDPDKPRVLWIHTDVPARWTLEPALLAWRMRAQPQPRELTLRFHPTRVPDPASVRIVVEDRDGTGAVFHAELKDGAAPNELRIAVTPASLRARGHAYLRALLRTDSGEELIGEAYLIVN